MELEIREMEQEPYANLSTNELLKLMKKIQKQIDNNEFEEDHEIKFILNHDLPQAKSKTLLALKMISLNHFANVHSFKYEKTDKKKVKLVSFVFTNNSLLEGKAWKSRTCIEFKQQNIKVHRLASDVKKNSGDYKTRDSLLGGFMTYAGNKNSKDTIPDVLIMCNHPKRVDDILNIIELNNNIESKVRNFHYRYNIYFDECDAGMCQSNFIRFVSVIYDETKNIKHLINEIHLITATPTEEMHKSLIQASHNNATKLTNLKKLLTDSKVINKGETCKRVKDYKTILDQKYLPFEGPKNPIDYVKKIHSERSDIFVDGKIYFIPSGFKCIQHDKMANLELFADKGFWILILNGNEKGFRTPLGDKRSINLKKGQELRDILRKWRAENPKAGLVITGHTVIERGLTFLTTGFCFDYMILSSYFAKHMAQMIQIMGRGNGKEEFVGNYTLITPQAMYDMANKYIQDTEAILNEEPEYYDEDMISSIGKKDKFANIEEPHYETSINDLSKWIKANIVRANGKSASIKVSQWKKKRRNENGFIMHKFGGTKENPAEEKVWSEEEALKQRGGLAPYSKRIFPCYSDTNDINSLKWYVFYRNH